MPSRLRVFSSVFLFALLVCAQLLAQSNSTSLARHKARALKRSAELVRRLANASAELCHRRSRISRAGMVANAVAIADVNGDGKPDLVVANWCTDSTAQPARPSGSAVGQRRRNLPAGGGLRFGRALCRLGRGSGRERGWQALT